MTTTQETLLSGRAQHRLSQLYRAMGTELRLLGTEHSLLLGALQACDPATQNVHLHEYLERLDATLEAIDSLRTFVVKQVDLHTCSTQSAFLSVD